MTNILRKTKKDYYNKLIENKKSDVREMWKILNKVIKKSSGQLSYPKYFNMGDKDTYNMTEVANTFNAFIVNIGKKLAENIPDPRNDRYGYCFIERNVNSMFLSPVEESEIIQRMVRSGKKCY